MEGYDAITISSLNEKLFKTKYAEKDYLFKTDVFACGIVFYELITKHKNPHKIFEYGKKMEGPELALEFDEDDAIWEPLIVGMTKRYYSERLSSTEALDLFNEIKSSLSHVSFGGRLRKIKRKSNRKSNRKSKRKSKRK